METCFLKKEDIFKFYDRIQETYSLYVPVKITAPFKVKCESDFHLGLEDYLIKDYSEVSPKDIVFSEYRSVEPIRTFLLPFKEKVSEYFQGPPESKVKKIKPLAISGVKNCDIFSLKVLDYVFLGGDEVDQAYKDRREGTLIISSDCLSFKESCFCRAFEINPHASEGFDFNLSPISNGYLMDIGSERAKKIALSLEGVLLPATPGQLSGRSSKREIVIKKIEEHLLHHKIPKKETLQDIVLSGFNSGVWKDEMRTCVECGGCIFVCDTCHCFLLYDNRSQGNATRMRVWDGCLLKNFSRVAGGANPLKMRYMRLRNRYLKKFDFFISNMGAQACCGCGRCIDVCPGKIDIRHILRRLYEEKHLSAS